MVQQALPQRDPSDPDGSASPVLQAPRLGKPLGATGLPPGPTVQAVALLLPGGPAAGVRRPSYRALAAQRPLARRLTRAGGEEGLAVHVLRYRHRGWNGSAADPVGDVRWAADEAVRRYGDVPVCLAGQGMGARAALLAAGHPAVASVLAVAPWLPEPDAVLTPDPVRQLAGRRVLIVHGTNDERTDPDLSYRLAERAKKLNRDVCRFEVHSDGHALHQHRTEVLALAADFVRGSLLGHPYARPVVDAFAAPPPLGLRMPLASGFGESLRH
ncbi:MULTISPECIES: alpha/beta hydrolase [Streptomyces]|uniref:Alpha/beta hydrolase n=1 Tax=Streptomyces ehimensis TaxID=68195 RepID=A0ABV9BJL9_9ACTN